jgi:FkbM family methyltransferase
MFRISEDWEAFGPQIMRVYSAGMQKRDEIEVTLRGTGSIALRPRQSDLFAFRQVFRDGEYDLSKRPQGKRIRAIYQHCLDTGVTPVIIDAGANVGAASLWYAHSFPQAAIIAIEPDPDNARLCRRNLQSQPQAKVFEAAVMGQAGSVNLKAMPEAWATRTERDASGAVKGMTIDDAMGCVPGQLCLLQVKVDIEGFESDLFAGDIDWIARACSIIVEPHDWTLPGAGTSASLQRVLFGRDFEILLSGENIAFVAELDEIKLWQTSSVH